MKNGEKTKKNDQNAIKLKINVRKQTIEKTLGFKKQRKSSIFKTIGFFEGFEKQRKSLFF